jgi:predicted MFS family arabinose efflux permease
MWFVVALCVVSGIGLVALLPAVPLLPKVGLAKRLAPIGDSAIGLTLLTTVLVYAGLYIVYNYIAVSYDRVTLGSGTTLAILLFVWGVAATLGNFVAGNLTDKFGNRTVVNVAIAVALLDFALMPLASAHLVSAVIAIVVWGLCGWGALVPQQHRLFQAAGPAGAALAISLNGAALFVAVSVSGLLGAAGINLFGAHQLGFAGAVFLLLGLVCAEGAWAIIAQRKAAAAAEAATVTAARTGGSATIDPVAKR